MTRIHARLAHHFWKDGHKAIWQADDNFPPSLLSWLKSNYSELVAGSRPQWIKRPEGVLFLFFKDEHEVHGRKATRLTACWFKETITNRNEVYNKLSKTVYLMDSKTLLVHAEIKKDGVLNVKRNILTISVVSLLVLIGYSILNTLVTYLDSSNESDKVASIDNTTNIQQEFFPVDKIDSSSLNMQNSFCSEILSTFPSSPEYCFQKYIIEKCSDEEMQNYDAWLNYFRKHNQSAYSGLNCPKALQADNDYKLFAQNTTKDKRKILENMLTE